MKDKSKYQHCEPEIIYPQPYLWQKEEIPDPVARGKKYDPPEPGKWKERIDCWLEERAEQQEKELDDCGRDLQELNRPRPYLRIEKAPGNSFHPSKTQIGVQSIIEFSIFNEGNYPAWTCYVDILEGMEANALPIANYSLKDRKITSLQPGEEKIVKLTWSRNLSTGRAVALIYDPLLDPYLFEVLDRNVTGHMPDNDKRHWLGWGYLNQP